LNLKAKSGKSITFAGTITDKATPTGIMNVGASGYTGSTIFNNAVTQKTITTGFGTTQFANTVTATDLNLNSGTLKLTANNILNSTNTTFAGGTFDLQTGAYETQNLKAFTLSGNTNYLIDANVGTLTADTIGATSATVGSNKLTISDIAWAGSKTDFGDDTKIALMSSANANLANAIDLGVTQYVNGDRTYKLSKTIENDIAYLTFGYGNLYTAVHDTSATRTYNMTADEPALPSTLTGYGTMEGPSTGDNKGTLTINGGGYSILGGGKGGITVNAGQTLNVNNVGAYTTNAQTGEVTITNNGWTGFTSSNNGGVLNNAGNLTITNSVFKGNSVQADTTVSGGAIYNTGTITDLVGTVFSGNKVQINETTATTANTYSHVGGAIYNAGTITNLGTTANKVTFTGNYVDATWNPSNSSTKWREYHGGARENNGGTITSLVADYTDN
jgi:hypothetical protein